MELISRKQDRVLFYCLVLVWSVILLFAFFTYTGAGFLKEISAPGRTEEAQALIDEGNKLMYEAERTRNPALFDAALKQFMNALKIDTANSAAMGNAGTACLYTGRYQEARNWFHKLLKTDTVTKYQTYTFLGDLEERLGNPQQALEFYLKAIPGHPDLQYPLRKAGLYSFLTGKTTEAEPLIRQSIVVENSFGWFYQRELWRALYRSVADKDTLTVFVVMQKLKQKDHDAELKKLDEESFRIMNRGNRSLGYSWLYLGDIFADRGEKDSAEYYYRLCLARTPGLRPEVLKRQPDLK